MSSYSGLLTDLSATVAIPNYARIKQLGVSRNGNPSDDQMDYVTTTIYEGYQSMATIVENSKLFSVVRYEEVDVARQPQFSTDVLIWLYFDGTPGNLKAQWYSLDQEGRKVPINFDAGANKYERVKYWLADVAKFVLPLLRPASGTPDEVS